MNLTEKILILFINYLCKIFYYILYPFKLILSLFFKIFQRPYSFFFLLNYFLLLAPGILLFSITINYKILISNNNYLIYNILLLISLSLNYIYNYKIYTIYQEHILNKNKINIIDFNVKKFFEIFNNFIYNHKSLIIFFLILIYNIIISSYILFIYNKNYFIHIPIENSIIFIIIIVNLIFSLGNLFIYILLFFTLFLYAKYIDDNKNNKNNIPDFIFILLDFFNFLKLFDSNKIFIKNESNNFFSNNETTQNTNLNTMQLEKNKQNN